MCEPTVIATLGAAVIASGTSVVLSNKQSNENKAQAEQLQASQDKQMEAMKKFNDTAPTAPADPNPEATAIKRRQELASLRLGMASTVKTSPTGLSGMKPAAQVPVAASPSPTPVAATRTTLG